MSTEDHQPPLLLQWSKRDDLQGVYLFATVMCCTQGFIGDDEMVMKGSERAIRERLLEMREKLAGYLNCKPERILFIHPQNRTASQSPEFTMP